MVQIFLFLKMKTKQDKTHPTNVMVHINCFLETENKTSKKNEKL